MSKTRQAQRCPVFGNRSEISWSPLPTYFGLVQNFLFIRQQLRDSEPSREPCVSGIAEIHVKLRKFGIRHRFQQCHGKELVKKFDSIMISIVIY
jgi:hypothetical protein